jgi:hypothetical protein
MLGSLFRVEAVERFNSYIVLHSVFVVKQICSTVFENDVLQPQRAKLLVALYYKLNTKLIHQTQVRSWR